MVDKISKYTYFYFLTHPYKVVNMDQLFIDNIFKIQSMPFNIISDGDPNLFLVDKEDEDIIKKILLEAKGRTSYD